ncbi:MAG: aryldialkylphosphatase [Dehalococcoidia bacterium]|nr:aryldialkylphosphatase [Dehalococcoidia bacterium]
MTTNAPNMAGKVMTVRGPIDPADLGLTLMHEHLFIVIFKALEPDDNTPATDWRLWDQTLTMDKLDLARARKPIRDNGILVDEREAIDEAMEFRYRGGGTIVDVTSIGIRRDPLALSRVSHATGLNVVMGAGWYQKLYHPADMDQKTVEEMTDEIVRDVTLGVGDTGIRSGIIGEVGIEGNPITENEVKSIRASGRASRATGAPISFHRGGVGREKLTVIGILGEEGTDMSRVIFGHSDPIASDLDLMLELLDHGVYIQFDLLGRVGAPLRYAPDDDDLQSFSTSAGAAAVADAIPRLIEAGHADRILLSQDVCNKNHLKRYGGTGYSFIVERFLPELRSRGVAEEHIEMMMVENPQRILTFVEPQS